VNVSPPVFFSAEDFRQRARARLPTEPPSGALDPAVVPRRGDYQLNAPAPEREAVGAARPAAVLIPVIAHPDGATILLTQRAAALRQHSGQVAFPGGKIEDGETPWRAALRETQEEIGLDRRHIDPVGWLEPYLTGTGFRILPAVAIVEPSFTLKINPLEVEDVFETPLSFLMNAANHQRHWREWQGRRRHFYAMPFGDRYIWGATAGILRHLYERLYA
jgi:8-oxo-dGTP pyrophosphatase MutT (NUDIX family)